MDPRVHRPVRVHQPARGQIHLRCGRHRAVGQGEGTQSPGQPQLPGQRIGRGPGVRLVQPGVHQRGGEHRLVTGGRRTHGEGRLLRVDDQGRVRAQEAHVAGVHQAEQFGGAERRRAGTDHLADAPQLGVLRTPRPGGEPAGLVGDLGGLTCRADDLQSRLHRGILAEVRLVEVGGEPVAEELRQLRDGLPLEGRHRIGVEAQVEAVILGHQVLQLRVGVQPPRVQCRVVDHGQYRGQPVGVRGMSRAPSAVQDRVVGGLGVPQDRRPQGLAEVDGARRGVLRKCGQRSPEPRHRGRRRQRVEHRLRLVGVAVVGGDDQFRLTSGRAVGQAGAGGGVGDELAATVDGHHRHEVEEAHAQTADHDLLTGADGVHRLVGRVAGADPVQRGVHLHAGGGEPLQRVRLIAGPAEGQNGRVRHHCDRGGRQVCGVSAGVVLQGDLVADDPVIPGDLGDLRGACLVDLDLQVPGDPCQYHRQHPAKVLAVEGAGGVGLRLRRGDLTVELAADHRRVAAEQGGLRTVRISGLRQVIAADQLDPLEHRRTFDDRRGDRGAGLGEQGHRIRQGVHAQRAGLVGAPDAAGTGFGVVDEVDGDSVGAAPAGISGLRCQLCGETFQDGDAAGASPDDRDSAR